jgi:hypothetical protein
VNHDHVHPLVAAGSALTGLGAVISDYAPTLVGFALTLLGLWLQHREHVRHETALAGLRPTPPAPRPPAP